MSTAGPAAGSVLGVRAFRRLWIGLGLSSLGDWLGLLALTAMANQLADGYAAKNYAIAGVLLLRVLPAIVIGPLAGYVADRLDRRATLIWGDYVRGAALPDDPARRDVVVGLRGDGARRGVSLVWGPAKDATVPNLVTRQPPEAANQISLATTYGSAVPAAALFSLLTVVDRVAPGLMSPFRLGAVDVALYLNGLSFIVSGLVIATLHEIPRGPADVARRGQPGDRRPRTAGPTSSAPRWCGAWCWAWSGAFAAGGVVVGLARTYVSDLGGGDAGYGVLFGAVFVGMALGLWRGPQPPRAGEPPPGVRRGADRLRSGALPAGAGAAPRGGRRAGGRRRASSPVPPGSPA